MKKKIFPTTAYRFLRQNKKGMTMVEVLVSFVILMIVMTALYSATRFSTTMLNKADEMEQNLDAAMTQYYLNKGTSGLSPETVTITLPNGKSVPLTLQTGTFASTVEGKDGYTLYFFAPDEDGGGTP